MSNLLHSDFDLLKRIENVQLGETDCGVAVDEGRVTQNGQIQPAAAADSSSGDTDLSAALLQKLSNILKHS